MKKLFYLFAFSLSTCSVFGDITFTGPAGGSTVVFQSVSASTPPSNSFLLLSDNSSLLLSDGGKLIIN